MSSTLWEDATAFDQALKNVRKDSFGDWYRDPWGWPEADWVVEDAPEILIARLNDTGIRRSVPIDVPKEGFVARPAVILDLVDRLMYQALVDSISVKLIGDLPQFVYGWRLWTRDPQKGRYAPNSQQWARYRHRLKKLSENKSFGLATDIVSFFRSIPIDSVNEEIRRTVRRNAVVDRLTEFLKSSQTIPSRGGLLQRCLASSALAQFYLRQVDDLLLSHSTGRASRSRGHEVEVCRWMDDVWLFCDNRHCLRRIQLEFQQCLSELGLHINAGKTRLYEHDDLKRHVKEYENSAADQGLESEGRDTMPLEEIIETILYDPELAPRTKIRFATSRMRKHKIFNHVGSFADLAHRLPHGADHLARLFRDSEAWRDLSDWYSEVAWRFQDDLPWVSYQLATMFPSSGEPSRRVIDYFADGLSSGDLPEIMVPVAAERLSAWDSDNARLVLQEAVRLGRYESPFACRSLAFAGLAAGVPRLTIQRMLGQFQETIIVRQFLDARNFKPAQVSRDFGGF